VMLVGIARAIPASAITGTVIDSVTQLPVESVLVEIQGTSEQTYTNAQGTFTISTQISGSNVPIAPDSLRVASKESIVTPKPEIVTLVFRKSGYLAKTQELTDGETGDSITLIPPQYGVEPTYENTGYRTDTLTDMTPQQALAAHGTVIRGKRITGSLDFKKTNNGSYDPLGKKYTFVDCEILGSVSIHTGRNSSSGQGNVTADDDMVTLNMSYCRVAGGINTTAGFKGVIDSCSFGDKSRWAANDLYSPGGSAPGRTFNVYQNCYFWAEYRTQPSHYEVAQSFTKIDGLTVLNCTFDQEGGPLANTGITAAVNLALAPDNVFDHCFFTWDGSAPAYYTIYAAGSGTFKNCFIEGGTSYLYPGSQSTFINCRDYKSNKQLRLP